MNPSDAPGLCHVSSAFRGPPGNGPRSPAARFLAARAGNGTVGRLRGIPYVPGGHPFEAVWLEVGGRPPGRVGRHKSADIRVDRPARVEPLEEFRQSSGSVARPESGTVPREVTRPAMPGLLGHQPSPTCGIGSVMWSRVDGIATGFKIFLHHRCLLGRLTTGCTRSRLPRVRFFAFPHRMPPSTDQSHQNHQFGSNVFVRDGPGS